ncbi:MAG: nanT 1 [Verrucomicrobiales bacterium]|nr:nanT 1 [Verrucomicrobiales bacterium]
MDSSAPRKLSLIDWCIIFVAVVGFAFDIYELLMLPLIVKPAIASLSAPLIEQAIASGATAADVQALWLPGGREYVHWARLLFFVPALAGGVFGLIGGYLTDRLGRRRVLTWSILLYGLSAFAAGFATSLPQLLFLRCLVFVGVCVEFVAAVAWLAELFPNPEQRERILGYTQAFSSVGGFMVAFANKECIAFAASLPAIHAAHEAWRYSLISGLLPAIPLMIIRPFLPESPLWQEKKATGTLKRPSFLELFQPAFARVTIVTTILFACSYALAFGAIQHLPQIVPGFADVKKQVQEAQEKMIRDATEQNKPKLTPKILAITGKRIEEETAAHVQLWQETGGLVGRIILAILAVKIVSRRALFRTFQIPALVCVPFVFWWISKNLGIEGKLDTTKWFVFSAGLVTVAQFSFWGNYLPRMYPVYLRGTGESFAANIGGRVFGTSAAWITLTLAASIPPSPAKIALMGAIVAGSAALIGAIVTFWLPEPPTHDNAAK